MQHINPYAHIEDSNISIDSIINNIPESARLQFEINLILTEGARSVRGCYERFASGTSSMTKSLSESIISNSELKELKKGFAKLKEHLSKSDVNEQALQIAQTAQIAANPILNKIDLSIDPELGKLDTEKEVGFLGLLDKIINGLTDDKSPLGFVHLLLDIVGVVGDAFGPVGLIADALNALIYALEGRYFLAILSVIGAMIPFAGPIIKRVFASGKAGKEVAEITGKYMKGSIGISDDAVKVAASASPSSIKALDHIVEHTSKAMSMASNAISTFFSGFLAKMVRFLPFGIGKSLSNVFKKIGSKFETFAKKSNRFAKDIPTIVKLADVKKLDKFFSVATSDGKLFTKGNKIVTRGDTLVVLNRSGKMQAKIPASLLKGSDVLKSKFGPNITKSLEKSIGKTEKATVNFYKSLGASIDFAAKKGTMTIFGKIYMLKTRMLLLLGKEIYKVIEEFGDKEGFNSKTATEADYKLVSIAHITNEFKRKQREDISNNKGALYSCPILDSIEDEDAYKIMNGHLEYNAKMLNLPGGFPKELNKHLQKKYKEDKDVQEYIKTFGIPQSSSYSINELKHISRYKG
jgi:hypothetical protein